MRGAVFSKASHEVVGIPFVNQDEIGAREFGLEVDSSGRVELAAQIRECGVKVLDGTGSRLGDQVLPAPAVFRLQDAEMVAAIDQLGGNAAEKMGVAVVPIGNERVGEDDYAHAFSGSLAAW